MGRMMWDAPEWRAKDAQLEALVADTRLSWFQIAQQVGVPADACRQRARRRQYTGWDAPGRPQTTRQERTHVTAMVSQPGPPGLSAEELWQLAEQRTSQDVARHAAERLVDVAIEDDRPIGLAFMSDQHFRQTGPIQTRRAREDAELVREEAGLYAALAGDGVDNHIKHLAAMAGGGDKPAHSWRLYEHYLGLFEYAPEQTKVVAMISGNHDDWTRDLTGVDRVALLARQRRLAYAPDEALLRLQVGAQDYRVLMRHQYRYHSSFNLGHAVKRLWEMGQDDFDVGVLGHHHEPACEPFVKHGLRRYALRPGSYQFTSSHGRRYGFNHSQPTCPTVVLWPNRRQLVGFWDVWEAASYLRMLRAGWPDTDLVRPAA